MSVRSDRTQVVAHLLLLGVVAVWGVTFPLVKGALADISPLLFNLLRMALAALALATVNFRRLHGLSRTAITLGMIAGAFLGAGYQFQTAGLARTSPTKSAFITGMVVILVAAATALPSFRAGQTSKARGSVVLGATVSFVGLALLTTTAPARSTDLLSGINLGDGLTLLCAVCFAGHLLTLSKVEQKTSAGALATLQITVATILMLLTLRMNGSVHFHPSLRLWTALLVTSVLATAAAFTIQSWAQQYLPASHTAALFTLEPVFALLTSVLLFHEQLTARVSLGAALIFTGIVVIERPSVPQPDPLTRTAANQASDRH